MKSLVDNSLLHLYLSVAETPRVVPVHKRNEILVRHLKPMLKDRRYRRIKSELRRLLSTGRSAKGDLGFCRKLRSSHYKLRKRTSSDTTRPPKNKIAPMMSYFQWCPFVPA